jgi:uncharacterized protein YjbI with pentapeptide repeats
VRDEDRKVEQEQKARERSFIRELVPDWRLTRAQVQSAIRIAVVVVVVILVVLFVLYLIGLCFGITVLKLLEVLAVPITVGAAVPLLNWLQKKRELDVESQRAKDAALQAYLDYMSQLLLDNNLRASPENSEARTLAQSRTLTVLPALDARSKANVVRFLYESGLIKKSAATVEESRLINKSSASLINLQRADLSGMTLGGEETGQVFPTPSRASTNLREADLSGTNLSGAELKSAILAQATLAGADLSRADLSGANLREADLTTANVYGANLAWADLSGATLYFAFLDGANLENARGLNIKELETFTILSYDTTLPDGQKYGAWLKDKEDPEEDGKNSDR